MLPVVALVGRPNVGKSTLFNTLTGTRDAIVADVPGVTRDRQYGYGRLGPVPYVVIDTGGLIENPSGMDALMRIQTERAVQEADRVVFVADARAGLTPQDQFFANELRKAGKPVFLAVNKAEGLQPDTANADFYSLGLGEPRAIAAVHGQGCESLMDLVLEGFEAADSSEPEADGAIRIAIIGRPNVGKSTLVNRLLGEERVIASEMPGTTRDSILVPFKRGDRNFLLIDTAGVRRRAKVEDAVERASVAKTLQAIDYAHVVIMVVDAQDAIGEQDASVLGLALQRGRALILAVNKWDNIEMAARNEIKRQLELKLDFVPFAPIHFISAKHGTGVGDLTAAAIRAYDGAMREMPTPKLTKTLEAALTRYPPPISRGRRIKLRYAHQGGRNPPRIIVHGSQASSVPEAYKRYLANVFREEYDLHATPVAVEFRSDINPFLRDKPKEKRGLMTAARERRERRLARNPGKPKKNATPAKPKGKSSGKSGSKPQRKR